MEFLLNPLIKKEEWNRFVLENGGSFLQSWEWGEFQESLGFEVLRLAMEQDGKILLSAQVFQMPLPFQKNYLYIPYGPVFLNAFNINEIKQAMKILLAELKKISEKNNSIFLKIEEDKTKFDVSLSEFEFIKSDKDVQARETLILDISKPEEDLLKNMKQKTRYNIKVAQKNGVEFGEFSDKKEAFEAFYDLISQTAERQKYRLHPKRHYEKMMELFFEGNVPEGRLFQKIFFVKYKDKILAIALIIFFGKRATYLHGGSSDEFKNLMAPHLLHWEIIKKAKELGFSEYDFWGIVTEKTSKKMSQKWSGFSRFKIGFSGDVVEYAGAYDFIYSKLWYNLYKIARKIHI